ncbi:uncharacterized protein [Cardiocondyla obscurior]|uniref:uncharacterized protein n=1 Tax=Cardiocondyla obscurior TaxID=286306 RepID=UPI00396569A6
MEIQEFENPSKATSTNTVKVVNSSLLNGTKITKTASSDSSKKRSFEHSYNSSNSISRSITKITSVDFIECKKVGFGKVMIECRDFNSANKIIDNPDLLNHGLKAFIPSFKLVRSGIIRDIPQELTPQELIEMIESKYEVIEVHRLNRRTNTSEEWVMSARHAKVNQDAFIVVISVIQKESIVPPLIILLIVSTAVIVILRRPEIAQLSSGINKFNHWQQLRIFLFF